MKKIIFIFSLLIVFSCDPMDDRMSFKNTSNDDVFVRIVFLNQKGIIGTMAGIRKIEKNENTIIGKLNNWSSEFDNAKQDSVSVIIYKNYDFLNDKYEQSSKIKSDSLLKVGDYLYKKYTYTDFENSNWKINYPKDGFKKGISLKFDKS